MEVNDAAMELAQLLCGSENATLQSFASEWVAHGDDAAPTPSPVRTVPRPQRRPRRAEDKQLASVQSHFAAPTRQAPTQRGRDADMATAIMELTQSMNEKDAHIANLERTASITATDFETLRAHCIDCEADLSHGRDEIERLKTAANDEADATVILQRRLRERDVRIERLEEELTLLLNDSAAAVAADDDGDDMDDVEKRLQAQIASMDCEED
jgi:chromosome segregation ATPase